MSANRGPGLITQGISRYDFARQRWVGSAYGIRTRDLRLERAVSLAARRMRHNFWLGILDSNQGYLIQSQASYR